MAACCSSTTVYFYGLMRFLLLIELLHLCALVVPGDAGTWPNGTFALPRAVVKSTNNNGCPLAGSTCNTTWADDGYVYFDPKDDGSRNDRSSTLNLFGIQPKTVELHFCVQTSESRCDDSPEWPQGCYCLFKTNSRCPAKFANGSLNWIGGSSRLGGTLPSAVKDDGDIRLDFCCRCDGSISTPIGLPLDADFYLMADSRGDGSCQAVHGTVMTPQFVLWDPPNSTSGTGKNPALQSVLRSSHLINITFCYYVPMDLHVPDMPSSSSAEEQTTNLDLLKSVLPPVIATGVIIVLLFVLLVMVCVVLCALRRRRTGTYSQKRKTSNAQPLLLSEHHDFHHASPSPEDGNHTRLTVHATTALCTSVDWADQRGRLSYETRRLPDEPADHSEMTSSSPYYKNFPTESNKLITPQDSSEEELNDEFWMPPLDEKVMLDSLERWKYLRIPACDIKLLDLIGQGNFGSVYRAEYTCPGGEVKVVAAKRLHQEAKDQDMRLFLQEATIMGQFRHQNIVKLFGTVSEKDLCYIVLEFMSNGNLRDYLLHFRKIIERIPDAKASTMCLRFAKEIAAGMDFLASKRFVHRDLAARNVLLDDNFTAKIGDFGCARNIADDMYYWGSGGMVPVRWTAPEALAYKKYSTASDVWSYGCVLYEIWSLGEKPFIDVDLMKFFPYLRSGERQHPPPGCPRIIYQIMIDCWNPVTSERPKFNAVQYLLGQPSEVVLAWNEEDTLVHEQAQTVGANINIGRVLYPDLQNAYHTAE